MIDIVENVFLPINRANNDETTMKQHLLEIQRQQTRSLCRNQINIVLFK